jgi:hypothetical protein
MSKLMLSLTQQITDVVERLPEEKAEEVLNVVRLLSVQSLEETLEEMADTLAVRETEAGIAAGQEDVDDWQTFEAELDTLPTIHHENRSTCGSTTSRTCTLESTAHYAGSP